MSEKLSEQVRKISPDPFCQQCADEVAELEEKLNNPTCHQGHSDYPLTLWDCPTCVQIEKKKLEAKIVQLQKDQAPFQAQIDQLKSYEVRCNYCKRTPAEAKGGYKCSTCRQGGDDEGCI